MNLMCRLLVCLLFFLSGLHPALAQDATPRPTTRGLLGTKPSLEWDARWPMPKWNRTLYVHWADQSAAGNERTWVHRPLFAFVERAEPLPDMPPIVIAREAAADGAETLTFEVLTTSEALRAHLARVLLNPDFARRQVNLNTPDIFMASWPLEDIVVDCRTNTNDQLLGSSTGGRSLASINDRVRFFITFGPEQLAEFRQRYASGSLVFDFRYTFTGRQVAELEESTQATRELVLTVKGLFTDKQISGESPIFQEDVNRAMSWLRVNYVRNIRSTDPVLLPMIKDSVILAQIFSRHSLTFDDIKQDEKLRAAVAEHLKPLVDTLTREQVTVDETVDTKTNRRTETIELDMSGSFSVTPGDGGGKGGEVKGSGKYKLEKERLNTIARTTGITFKETDVKNRYAPQSITVFKLNTGQDVVEMAGRERMFVALGRLTDYFVDSEVPASFTEQAVLGALERPLTAPIYDGVPLGTMVPYFGDGVQPPRGYVFADGQSNWPTEDWVPLHLRGKPVPNMGGQTAYGFAELPAVGMASGGNSHVFTTTDTVAPGLSVSDGSVVGLVITTLPRNVIAKQDIGGDYSVPLYPAAYSERHWNTYRNYRREFSPQWDVPVGPTGTNSQAHFAGAANLSNSRVLTGVKYGNGSGTIAGAKVTVDPAKLTPAHVGVRWIIRVK